MEWLLVEVVFLHWLLERSLKHFNNFTGVQESFCYLCSQHLIKVILITMIHTYQENKK